ncbi:MAG: SLAP domain-containing protein [Clostridia bacterium]|nr:SLAP domain-containing protein [Clostridia bacterium]
MKKLIIAVSLLTLTAGLTACGNTPNTASDTHETEPTSVVVTVTSSEATDSTTSESATTTSTATTAPSASEAATTANPTTAKPTTAPTTAKPTTSPTTTKPTTAPTTNPTTADTSFYDANALRFDTNGGVAIEPYKMVWNSNGTLTIQCYVINNRYTPVGSIDVKKIVVINSSGQVVADAAFGYLNNLTLGARGYTTWTFTFGTDCVQHVGSDLSGGRIISNNSYVN